MKSRKIIENAYYNSLSDSDKKQVDSFRAKQKRGGYIGLPLATTKNSEGGYDYAPAPKDHKESALDKKQSENYRISKMKITTGLIEDTNKRAAKGEFKKQKPTNKGK